MSYEAVSKLFQGKFGFVWFIITMSFFGGMLFGSEILGPSSDVSNIRRDMRGLACMYVSIVEDIDGRYCELLLSTDTREYLSLLREGTGGPVRGGPIGIDEDDPNSYFKPSYPLEEIGFDVPLDD